MSYIFTTKDPLGREIKLKEHTWNIHITGEHRNRREFTGEEEKVKNIIEDPKIIVKHPKKSTQEVFMDIVDLAAFEKLKVCTVRVQLETNDLGITVGDICTVIAQSSINISKERGVVYVRPRQHQ